jgi:hypothetical protein
MSSKDIACSTEGKKFIEFCEGNIFEILDGKYGADNKG